MWNRRLPSCAVALLWCVAQAASLGTSNGGGYSYAPPDGVIEVRLYIGDCFEAPYAPCAEYFNEVVSTADIARTFTIDAASFPDFATLAQLLTNGADDRMSDASGRPGDPIGGERMDTYESSRFYLPPGTDFSGNTITDLQVTITDLSTIEGRNSVNYRLDVNGTPAGGVPEPGSVVLLAVGLSLWGAGYLLRRHCACRFPIASHVARKVPLEEQQ